MSSTKNRKVKAGTHVAAMYMQAEAAAEAKLRGPHAFPLERMLATFWELRSAQDEEPAGAAEQRDAQSGDLFMEISSLVSMRFLSQVRALDMQSHGLPPSESLPSDHTISHLFQPQQATLL